MWAGYCDRYDTTGVGRERFTYNLAGCLAAVSTTTTTTTTTAAACAGQIICGDLPDSIGDAWSTTYKYPMGPKRKFGPDGTWATPYCKDVRGCETVYCPNG